MSHCLARSRSLAQILLLGISCVSVVASDDVAIAIGLKAEVVVTDGLNLPIIAGAPTGDFDHLYIAESRIARIQRLDLSTNQLVPVLDLPDSVIGVQTGLNGFAFHPDFANNGKIYINFSGSNLEPDIRILEFTRSATNPNVFDPTTQREILTIANPLGDHNGGWLAFGPDDNLLYIATGDGGNAGPQELKGLAAQDVNDVKGKILRIDIDEDDFPEDSTRNYGIPEDNPFASSGGAPEIFALGLRHPFRGSFDRDTSDLYIADVGSRFWEEINFLPAGTSGGQNYGWRPLEGLMDNPDWSDPAPPDAIDPIYLYPHGGTAAVIGGYVYRGDEIPWLQGTYFFGDFQMKTLMSFRYDGGEVSDFVDRGPELASLLGSYGGIASFAEDAAGELYMIDYIRGDVYRIVAAAPQEYGDYNRNGVVDAADYTVWRDSLGQMGAGLAADGNGNSEIDAGDYAIWAQFFGESLTAGGQSSGSSVAISEPVTSILLAVALSMLLAIGRYRGAK